MNASVEAAYLLDLGVFDNRAVLRMWSQTTPRAIFPDRRIGNLSAGHEASFLALPCNPIADFGCTRQITLRMKQGARSQRFAAVDGLRRQPGWPLLEVWKGAI